MNLLPPRQPLHSLWWHVRSCLVSNIACAVSLVMGYVAVYRIITWLNSGVMDMTVIH